MAPVSSLNTPSETRTMLGISTLKNTKSFSYLKMAKWIKFKFKGEKNPGLRLLMPSFCLEQIFVVAY